MNDPRKVGGRYYCGYWRYEYTVLAIEGSKITERMETMMDSNLGTPDQIGKIKSHYTAWDGRNDKIIEQPEPKYLSRKFAEGES